MSVKAAGLFFSAAMKSRFVSFLILLSAFFSVASADDGEKVSIIPQVGGTFRGRWEMDLSNDASRFQVRNARLVVSGSICREITYFFQTDLCDRGKITILDAYGQLVLADGFNLRVGQFRMPMGVEPFRAPHTYLFANRSTIGKEVNNFRAVGGRLSYTFARLPVTLEAGAFNPTAISDHNVWCHTLAYSSKARYKLGNTTFTTGFQSIRPDATRINFIDAAIGWCSGRWTVEGEYVYEHYTRRAFDPCHAWTVFGDYAMPVKAGVFNRLSFQARYDGMTDHNNGFADEDGKLTLTDDGRQRITVGTTLSYRRSRVWCDIRLNYEKYFYHHSSTLHTSGRGDRLLAELVIHF